MSVLNNSLLLGADAAGGYTISRSLRFNSADSAYLSRTPASAGNRKTWTWAGWVKRSGITGAGSQFQTLFSAGSNSGDELSIRFNDTDTLEFYYYAGTYSARLLTSAVYRDPSSWYHIVAVFDTPASTTDQRIRLYVNGSEVTTFSARTNPTQNLDGPVSSTIAHAIGGTPPAVATRYLNGYLADIHFIDGQALDPTSFGEFSATTGVWMPKAFSGSYGTNGFRLTFADNSAATATTLGKDAAGSNNWTPTNLSVTAGAGNDSFVDVPTNGSEVDTGLGNQVRGNYATWNPITGSAVTSNFTITNGNLDASGSNANQNPLPSTIFASTGKWYCEFVRTSGSSARFGVINQAGVNEGLGAGSNGWAWLDDGRLYYQSSVTSYGTAISTGDVVMIALDLDAGKVWYGRNGTWFGSGNPATGANPSQTFTANQSMSPAVATGGACAFTANFGARSFAYTAPSGFKALCTANLPAPTIVNPSTVMDVALWTGTGSSTRSVSGLAFSPEFVWFKSRSNSFSHNLYDAVRGAGSGKNLLTDKTEAEGWESSVYGYISSFDSTGFSLAQGSNSFPWGNQTNATYVAWCWDAGSSTVTNTQGSITSSVRANPSAGFSVATYTGNLSSAGVSTVGHGLGVAPHLVITKRRDGASNWCVQHISTSSASQILFLDTTDAQFNTSGNGTLSRPTSSVFSVNNSTGLGVNGQTHVAYCFAPVAGYSSFGSYTGNGSADGPFVYTGFRPRWILLKDSTNAGSWELIDTARIGYNGANYRLFPNLSDAEFADHRVDILSNGFKLRVGAGSAINSSNAVIVYAAFAESPFQYARAR